MTKIHKKNFNDGWIDKLFIDPDTVFVLPEEHQGKYHSNMDFVQHLAVLFYCYKYTIRHEKFKRIPGITVQMLERYFTEYDIRTDAGNPYNFKCDGPFKLIRESYKDILGWKRYCSVGIVRTGRAKRYRDAHDMLKRRGEYTRFAERAIWNVYLDRNGKNLFKRPVSMNYDKWMEKNIARRSPFDLIYLAYLRERDKQE